jgi:hypothetical protein
MRKKNSKGKKREEPLLRAKAGFTTDLRHGKMRPTTKHAHIYLLLSSYPKPLSPKSTFLLF